MGSANSYTENTTAARTDMILGIDAPAGSWSIQRYQIAEILSLIEADDIPIGITVDATSTVATGALVAALQTYAGITPSANVQAILGAATYAAIRALLDLEAGTDFYSIAAADAAFEPAGVTEADISDLGTSVTMNADTSLAGNGWFIDEDSMASNLATKVPSQQSVKAYVDNKKIDDLTAPDDNTDLDVSTSAHGLCPKAPNETDKWLRGDADWQKIPYADLALTYVIDDISTAGYHYIPIPVAGDITLIQSVISGAIATADCGLVFDIGGVGITGGAITIGYSGSGAGDYDYCEPSALNTVAIGDILRIYSNGASTNTIKATIVIKIER
jgi:hypothetical protein